MASVRLGLLRRDMKSMFSFYFYCLTTRRHKNRRQVDCSAYRKGWPPDREKLLIRFCWVEKKRRALSHVRLIKFMRFFLPAPFFNLADCSTQFAKKRLEKIIPCFIISNVKKVHINNLWALFFSVLLLWSASKLASPDLSPVTVTWLAIMANKI